MIETKFINKNRKKREQWKNLKKKKKEKVRGKRKTYPQKIGDVA